MSKNISTQLNSDLYYKPGDTETLAWWGGGTVTTAARDLFFSIPVSKKMTKISKITATIIHLDIRQNNV